MNPSEARHCSACGTALGASVRETPVDTRCPGCKVALLSIDIEPSVGRVLDCPKCGGQFVEHAVLRALLERPPCGSEARAHKGGWRPENPLQNPIVYRACPSCAALMHRKNFGGRSGIIVDVCALHGIWFDREELARVIAFVEAGGLARTPNRAPLARPPAASVQTVGSPSLLPDAVDVALGVPELLSFLSDLIGTLTD